MPSCKYFSSVLPTQIRCIFMHTKFAKDLLIIAENDVNVFSVFFHLVFFASDSFNCSRIVLETFQGLRNFTDLRFVKHLLFFQSFQTIIIAKLGTQVVTVEKQQPGSEN